MVLPLPVLLLHDNCMNSLHSLDKSPDDSDRGKDDTATLPADDKPSSPAAQEHDDVVDLGVAKFESEDEEDEAPPTRFRSAVTKLYKKPEKETGQYTSSDSDFNDQVPSELRRRSRSDSRQRHARRSRSRERRRSSEQAPVNQLDAPRRRSRSRSKDRSTRDKVYK